MAAFDSEKAYAALAKKLDTISDLLEVLVIVNASSSGVPSTKIREILKIDQGKVSNITKLMSGRAPAPGKQAK